MLLGSSDCLLRRYCLSDVPLVVTASEFLLEPIDHVLEWVVVLVMEEVASGLDLDELSDELFLWNVSHDHILWVLVQYRESVWDSGCIFSLLSFQSLLELIEIRGLQELGVL